MNTSLKHLSATQQDALQRIKRIIVRAIQPEKIILFGIYASPVGEGGVLTAVSMGAYDLLIITREGDRRSDYELQDIIENRCREEAPVTALVHDIGYVNRRLSEGQYFFCTLR